MTVISANAALSDASSFVTFEGNQIPVIKSTDVLVVGSMLDACFWHQRKAMKHRLKNPDTNF